MYKYASPYGKGTAFFPPEFGEMFDSPVISRPKMDDPVPPKSMGRGVYGSGYGDWKYNKHSQKLRAKLAIRRLMQAMFETGTRDVVVHGTSGTMIVGTVLALWPEESDPPRFIMVRKDDENSHGSYVESNISSSCFEYIVLEDFIGSGRTLNRIADKMEGAVMKAVVLHDPEAHEESSKTVNGNRVRIYCA